MSKRKNRVFIICLAFLVSASIGYALFRQDKLVTSTTKTNGKFDVSITCQNTMPSDVANYIDVDTSEFGGYSTNTCSVTNNTVSINVSFKYPGAVVYKTISITNNGSIPFVMEVPSGDSDETYAMLPFMKSGTFSATVNGESMSYSYTDDYYWLLKSYLIESDFVNIYMIRKKDGTLTSVEEGDSFFKEHALFDVDSEKTYAKVNGGETLIFLWLGSWDSKNEFSGETLLEETYEFPIQQITNSMITYSEYEQYIGS